MSDHDRTNHAKTQHHPGPDTPRRPGQPGEQDQQRPGPSPDSSHPTGPSAPYDSDSGAVAERIRQDAAGQYGNGDQREPGRPVRRWRRDERKWPWP